MPGGNHLGQQKMVTVRQTPTGVGGNSAFEGCIACKYLLYKRSFVFCPNTCLLWMFVTKVLYNCVFYAHLAFSPLIKTLSLHCLQFNNQWWYIYDVNIVGQMFVRLKPPPNNLQQHPQQRFQVVRQHPPQVGCRKFSKRHSDAGPCCRWPCDGT